MPSTDTLTVPPRLSIVPRADVPPALLRRAMGHFATGVTVITARDGAGDAYGTTANAVTSVSLEPPLVLVCLRHASETLTALLETRRFGVNVLGADARAHSDRFATRAHDGTWDGVAHRVSRGVPLLDDAVARLECDLHDVVDAGDHAIVIGRVVAADHPDEHVDPLLFYRGAYGALEAPAAAAAAGPPPTDVRASLPSALGTLRMLALASDDEGDVSVAVAVGEPEGRSEALLYLHRGCLLGDAVGSTVCGGRLRLQEALTRMGEHHPGVVVYHRRRDGAGCCLPSAGGAPSPGPTDAEVVAVRRAVRALSLGRLALIGDRATADALAAEGVPVTGPAPATFSRPAAHGPVANPIDPRSTT